MTYRHYSGKLYNYLGIAFHTETEEKMVVYQALYDCPDLEEEYGARPIFVRPYDMFHSTVEVDGVVVQRFEQVQED